MELADVLTIRAGKRARQQIAAQGLSAAMIDAVPAAAGGPKGLALLGLDKYLFGHWLQTPPASGRRRILAGASIGAWRMTAAASMQPVGALHRLGQAYVEQRYDARKPPRSVVSDACRIIVQATVGAGDLNAANDLMVVTARSIGLLKDHNSLARFGSAFAVNLASRASLAHFFQRIIFRTPGGATPAPFDAFGWHEVALSAENMVDALAASGAIPLVMNPRNNISGAPAGMYWDGGLIDYHLGWPWGRLDGLVLYPHFVDRIVPGWLDKSIPWRRAHGEQVSNVILIAPSPKFLASLPLKKLPDRKDFYRFENDNGTRIALWRETMAECERMAEAFADFCARPDPARLQPLR